MHHGQIGFRLAIVAMLAAGSACSESEGSDVELGTAATSAQIQAARDAADGPGLALPIQGAYVTYVRPLIGADAAGFFIQSQRVGPALFVRVDPATLSPPPVRGDRVDLTITEMTTVASRREAAALTGWSVVASGVAIGALVKDLSGAGDLVSGLDGYEAELSRITGVLRTGFSGAGNGFVAAGLDTAALVNEPLLAFRLPSTLQESLDLALGCAVTVSAAPLWRTDLTAQATAWAGSDVTVQSCPAPRVLSAVATGATSVRVTFDRVIDPASILADGSQFAFDGALVAAAASAEGDVVTVTTSAQAGDATYTVTVAGSVEDLYGTGVDPAFDQASFSGFVTPAGLLVNEVNASISLGADLVELRVTTPGSLRDMVLQVGVGTPVTLATLPDLAVAAGDLIVVHMSPGAGIVTETTAKDACADPACYAGAWDVAGGSQNLNDGTRILAVLDPLASIVDAVPFTDGTTTGMATFLSDLAALQADGLWLPADCGGEACGLSTTPTALEISADWSGMGTTATGSSVARTSATDTNLAEDWAVGAQTFGAANY